MKWKYGSVYMGDMGDPIGKLEPGEDIPSIVYYVVKVKDGGKIHYDSIDIDWLFTYLDLLKSWYEHPIIEHIKLEISKDFINNIDAWLHFYNISNEDIIMKIKKGRKQLKIIKEKGIKSDFNHEINKIIQKLKEKEVM